MTLGTFVWKNQNPDLPYFGDEVIIDLDTLPMTTMRSNFITPNLHIEENGNLIALEYPLFYFAPDGQIFLSSLPPDINADDNIIYFPPAAGSDGTTAA